MYRFIFGCIFLIVAALAMLFKRFLTRTASNLPELAADSRYDEYGDRRQKLIDRSEIAHLVIIVASVLSVVLLMVSFVRLVGANQVGIPVTLGKRSAPIGSGLHATLPWTSVIKFSTKQEESVMVASDKEGDRKYDDSVQVNSNENGRMYADTTVRYRIDKTRVDNLFLTLGNSSSPDRMREKILRPKTQTVMRNIYGLYPATEVRTSKRVEILEKVKTQLAKDLAAQGIELVDLNIGNIAFDEQLQKQVNAKLEAQQSAEKAVIDQQREATEADTRRKVAETDAQANVVKAQGEAQAAVTRANGEAEANRMLAASLTPSLIEMERAKALSKAQTIYVPSDSNLLIGR